MKKKIKDEGQEKLLREITSLLQKEDIPYMVTGALSVIFYGRPRASHDIDFVIEAQREDIDRVKKAFSSLSQEFLIQEEAIEEAIIEKLSFNVLHLPTMLKLDFFLLRNSDFDKSRFARRKTFTVFGQKMVFASPEDTILIKLLWYKESTIEKHLVDAAFIYQIQEDKLDRNYMENWVRKQETLKLFNELGKINLEQHY